MAFRKGDGVVVMALALIAFAVAWAVAQEPPQAPPGALPEPQGSTSMGPVVQIGPTGYTGGLNDGGKALCRDAPLRSFGSACEGYTWGRAGGVPVEWRSKVGGFPDPTRGQFFGFM